MVVADRPMGKGIDQHVCHHTIGGDELMHLACVHFDGLCSTEVVASTEQNCQASINDDTLQIVADRSLGTVPPYERASPGWSAEGIVAVIDVMVVWDLAHGVFRKDRAQFSSQNAHEREVFRVKPTVIIEQQPTPK